jgi:tetratricopeptide (TPR) repeat protein
MLPQRLTLASDDRIAPAFDAASSRVRIHGCVMLALAILLVGGTRARSVECPPDAQAKDAPIDAGCSVAPPAATAAASPASSNEEGQRELALAKQALDRGEAASDDDSRRRAYEEAKQHADRAVTLMPDNADARFAQFGADGRLAQLGGMAVAALQLVKANKQLDEVLRLDPNHANALAARGGMLMKLPRLLGGNTKKGVEYLERAVALDDTAVGKRLELAEAYHIVGREDDATAAAQGALETAQKMNDPGRVAACERFITELKKTCSGCAVATIGR